MSVKFNIVVPVYNAERWIKKCLESIRSQTHQSFVCVVMDDASTDRTREIIDSMKLPPEKFLVFSNETNKGALFNIWSGFRLLGTFEQSSPEDVLMVIDGDDWLYSENSLEVVDRAYSIHPELLLTYGNHLHHPSGAKSNCRYFPGEVLKDSSFRSYPLFVTSHLRTFRRRLWEAIREKDLKSPSTGEFFRVAWDVAFMMPMLEMAQQDRIMFIEQLLYVYNRANPLSDDVIRPGDQANVDQYVRSLPRYSRL